MPTVPVFEDVPAAFDYLMETGAGTAYLRSEKGEVVPRSRGWVIRSLRRCYVIMPEPLCEKLGLGPKTTYAGAVGLLEHQRGLSKKTEPTSFHAMKSVSSTSSVGVTS